MEDGLRALLLELDVPESKVDEVTQILVETGRESVDMLEEEALESARVAGSQIRAILGRPL